MHLNVKAMVARLLLVCPAERGPVVTDAGDGYETVTALLREKEPEENILAIYMPWTIVGQSEEEAPPLAAASCTHPPTPCLPACRLTPLMSCWPCPIRLVGSPGEAGRHADGELRARGGATVLHR